MLALLNPLPLSERMRTGCFDLVGLNPLTLTCLRAGSWSASAAVKIDAKRLLDCCPADLGVKENPTPLDILTAIYTPQEGQRVSLPMVVFARYVSLLT